MAAVAGTIKKLNEAPVSRTKGTGPVMEFTLSVPGKNRAARAGTNTISMPMKKGADGIWRIKVKLPRGLHE